MNTEKVITRYPNKKGINNKFDKKLVNVSVTTNASQSPTSILTSTYPCVTMGIVVTGMSATLVASLINVVWVLVVLPEGDTINNVVIGGTNYSPEQHVMCFGSGVIAAGAPLMCNVKIKTGRKIRGGDQLFFLVRSDTANNVQHCYTIQYFCKV